MPAKRRRPPPRHHHNSLPLAGSKLRRPFPVSLIPEASTSIWGCPFTEMMTGVLWAKAMSGNFRRHFTAPLALLKATTLESLALAIAHNMITVSW